MATMTIKNLPEELYDALKGQAERHRRSINSEAIVCLERALRSSRIAPELLVTQARELRARTADLYVTDDQLRSARDEGRV